MKSIAKPGWWSGICGLAVAVLGMTVMVGWHTGSVSIVRLQNSLAWMQYFTAFCFLSSGLGLAAFAFRMPRGLSLLCGLIPGILGLILSMEYLLGRDLGMNLIPKFLPGMPGMPAMKPSPPASLGFALCGLGIVVLSLRLPLSLRRLLIWICGSSCLALGLMAISGYVMGYTVVFLSGSFIGMALHTALGIVTLSLGLLATQWTGTSGGLREDPWLPVPVGTGIIAASIMLWQAMAADRLRAIHGQAEVIAQNVATDAQSRFTFSIRALNRIKQRWEQSGDQPYPEWRTDVRDCLQDEPVFEAIGRTDASWRVTFAELDHDAEPLVGRDLHAAAPWDLEKLLSYSISNHLMVISPTQKVRGNDKGFLVLFPTYKAAEFTGFVFGVFRLQDLKEATLDQPAFATCRIAVYEHDLFILGELPVEPPRDKVKAESRIEFRGSLWRFVVEPRSGAMAGGRLPVLILWLGVLLGGAMAAAVWGIQQAMARSRLAIASNQQLKAEISERQLAERNLQESEKRLGLVLDSAIGVSVITSDLAGVITYFSKGAEHLLGYRAGDMVGNFAPPMMHDPEETAARSVELTRELGYEVNGIETFAAIPRLKGSERREWTYLLKDGCRRTVDLMVTVLRDTDGEPTGYLGTAVDITDRKMMERELRESLRAKKKSQALLESAGRIAQLGHWEFDLDGSGPRWSDITYAIHDVPPGTPVSFEEALSFYHAEDRPGMVDKVEKAIKSGEAYEFEGRLITRNGRQVWVYSRGQPVRDENGVVIAVHGIFQNIDERRKAADLLKQRNIELEAATARAEAHARAKAEFLANMSHEIRTPLNAVIGMSELLMDGELDDREREFVETIHSSGDVLLSLINDILDFSKIESGQLDLEHIPVPLRECVESVLDLLAGQASKKQLDLMYWIDPAVPAAILGDPTRLRQVLVNLASNAIKFTPQGEVLIKLSVRKDESGQWLHVAVSDTGIGISAEGKDRLFGVFSQVDASTTRRFGGTGLGLAIAQRLIQNMGGSIRVESEEGKGSVFHFEIPLLAVDAPSSFANASLRTLEGLRVLLVDDNATNRWILNMQTESWHMLPTAAGSAAQALERIRTGEPFDLAIIDVKMPDMDGYQLAAEIRRHRGPDELPILMLSSMGDRGRELAPLGISGVLTKPVKTTALLNALRGIMTTAHRRTKAATAPLPGSAAPEDFLPMRILVAEDNPVNQRVTALHLQRLGYQPTMVVNGVEVLDALQHQTYDIILLDVQMPVMDGLETAREICRRYPAGQRPWMVALTANALGGDKDECLAAGMDDYLSKPVRSGSLQAALRAAHARQTM